jgi:hypothetical protein
MRQGFEQFCPDCVYASLMHKAYGKCYCQKFRMMISKKRFPPSIQPTELHTICNYFKDKHSY